MSNFVIRLGNELKGTRMPKIAGRKISLWEYLAKPFTQRVTLRSLRMRSCSSTSWRVSAEMLTNRRSLASSKDARSLRTTSPRSCSSSPYLSKQSQFRQASITSHQTPLTKSLLARIVRSSVLLEKVSFAALVRSLHKVLNKLQWSSKFCPQPCFSIIFGLKCSV